MRRTIVLLAWVCCGCVGVAAAAPPAPTPPANTDEQAELAQLMAILQEETEIATKTRMNSDFVPGLVTVLHGDELEALGVENVWEALRLVPGIEPVLDELGMPSVVVRGIDFPFNSGNVKTLVDSVPLTRESAGINGAVLFWPIQMVERIEVIRGPGSVIYGDFAFMGLVNIVTRKEGHRVEVRGDSRELWSGSARAGAVADAPVQWSVGLAGATTNDAMLPRPRRGDQDRVFGQGRFGYRGFSLSAHYIDVSAGDTGVMPPQTAREFDQRSWAVEAGYAMDMGENVHTTLRFSRLGDNLASPGSDFDDALTRGGLDVHWSGGKRHEWLAALEYSALDIRHAEHANPTVPDQQRNPTPGAQAPGTQMPGTQAPTSQLPATYAINDQSRRVFSATLQDRFDVTDAFSLTGGLRLDDYDDIGTRVTPRASLVWRASEHHILKAQYAQGFRPPTFFEQFGGGNRNPDLGFETNATSELNYIFRQPEMTGRVTLFYTQVDDMIYPVAGTSLFSNSKRGRAHGLEAEWSQQLTSRLKAIANLSLARSKDDRSARPSPLHDVEAAADWMGQLALLARLSDDTLATAHWSHVAQRGIPAAGPYDLVDVTVTLQNLLVHGLRLRGGVRNLFDDRVAYVLEDPRGVSTLDYGDRTLWAQVSWGR